MNRCNNFLLLLFGLLLLTSCREKGDVPAVTGKEIQTPYFRVTFDPDEPGCGVCHNDPDKREYTLAAKANEKWEDHNFPVQGKMMTINDCLTCHSVVSSGTEGTIASIPLRTIVHQIHMSSSRFETEDEEGNIIKGNCFTCHYIMGDSSRDLYGH